jgi:hypothetical protein
MECWNGLLIVWMFLAVDVNQFWILFMEFVFDKSILNAFKTYMENDHFGEKYENARRTTIEESNDIAFRQAFWKWSQILEFVYDKSILNEFMIYLVYDHFGEKY